MNGLPWWLSGKELLPTREMPVWSLGQEDHLEKEMTTYLSILAWEIPWTEEPVGLQSMKLQRGRHDLVFSSVQLLSRVQLFATPWTAARQASLSIESMMPSHHLFLCRPLLLLPSIFPSIRVFSNESALGIRWPKYWSFSFNISFQWTLKTDLL